MKKVKRYCENCNKDRKHIKEKEYKGATRIFFGVFSAGLSEITNRTYYTCCKCNNIVEIWNY